MAVTDGVSVTEAPHWSEGPWGAPLLINDLSRHYHVHIRDGAGP